MPIADTITMPEAPRSCDCGGAREGIQDSYARYTCGLELQAYRRGGQSGWAETKPCGTRQTSIAPLEQADKTRVPYQYNCPMCHGTGRVAPNTLSDIVGKS